MSVFIRYESFSVVILLSENLKHNTGNAFPLEFRLSSFTFRIEIGENSERISPVTQLSKNSTINEHIKYQGGQHMGLDCGWFALNTFLSTMKALKMKEPFISTRLYSGDAWVVSCHHHTLSPGLALPSVSAPAAPSSASHSAEHPRHTNPPSRALPAAKKTQYKEFSPSKKKIVITSSLTYTKFPFYTIGDNCA